MLNKTRNIIRQTIEENLMQYRLYYFLQDKIKHAKRQLQPAQHSAEFI